MSEKEQIILPEGFRRVEYLQSTGTQYIDTEYIPDNETGYWADAININGKNSYLLGLNNTNDWNSNQRLYLRTATTLAAGWITYNTINSTNYSGLRVVGRMNYLNDRTAHYSVDNKEYSGALADLNFTPAHSIYIFGINFGGTIDTAAAAFRLYGVKISQGSEVVRHFIPCVNEDEVGCLYDIIEKKVYYNAGSGDFKYPKDWEDEEDETLPEGFKRLKYISFTKQQWIKTGVYVTNTLGAKVKYSRTSDYSATNDTKHCYILSARSQTAGNGENNAWGIPTTLASTENHPFRCSFGPYYQNDNIRGELGKVYEVEHNYLNSSKSLVNNELLAEYNRSLFISNNYCKNELILGSFVNDELFPYNAYNHYGRLYYCTITDGEEIIRNYIPCLDSSGEPCLYETVNGTVHYNEYNVSGFEVEYITERKTNNYYELPAGFKKCIYLQSDGTQWIDTGVIPDSETGLYFKALQLSYGNLVPFGVEQIVSGTEILIYLPRFSNKDLYYRWGTSAVKMMTWDKAEDLIFHSSLNFYNSKIAKFDSEDTDIENYISSQSGTFTYPIWLFSVNCGGSYNENIGKWGGRIFRAQITQGDMLIRDFVPCLDADNRPCMYDLITQKAYYNQSGGTEFVYCVEHQLPSDFIKLKYLESTGTQIIKTGYIPTNNTGLYIDAYHTKYNGNTNGCTIGLRNTNGNTYFFAPRVQRDTNGAGFGWGAFTTPGGNGNCRYEGSLNFLNDRKAIIAAPAFARRINALGTLAFTPTKDLYMFGMNNYDGAATSYSTYRIYRAKISEGSEIVRDFVPAYDERKTKPCMYDLINNVAYYNDGTGEFLYNRDFEGTYKGYRLLSTVGNRLGYGDPIKGISPETLGVTLLDGPLELGSGTYVNTLLETANSNTWGTFDFAVPEYYNSSAYPIGFIDNNGNISSKKLISMNWTFNLLTLDARFYTGYYLYTQLITNGPRYRLEIDKNNICTVLNDDTILCDHLELPHDEYFTFTPEKYFIIDNSYQASTLIQIYQMQFLDKEGKIMGDMYPAEKDGQYGLYCMIRNIFLPVQTI